MMRSIVAGLLLLAAGAAQAQNTLNIYNWNDYVSPQALERFERETGIRVRYDTYDSNETLDAKLRAGRSGYDLVVPTASPFLALQLAARLYQPFDRAKLSNFANLDPQVMRDLSRADPGNRFAIPHMSSLTGIGYNAERVGRVMADAPVFSLRMVFDPEIARRFQSCGLVMLDSPTDVFPAALAYLGLDPDSKDPAHLVRATELLMRIRPFVRKWHGSEYINDLANGDACVAFGYSGDIKQAAARAREAKRANVRVEFAIPQEGALLAHDVWAIPADARAIPMPPIASSILCCVRKLPRSIPRRSGIQAAFRARAPWCGRNFATIRPCSCPPKSAPSSIPSRRPRATTNACARVRGRA